MQWSNHKVQYSNHMVQWSNHVIQWANHMMLLKESADMQTRLIQVTCSPSGGVFVHREGADGHK